MTEQKIYSQIQHHQQAIGRLVAKLVKPKKKRRGLLSDEDIAKLKACARS